MHNMYMGPPSLLDLSEKARGSVDYPRVIGDGWNCAGPFHF